MRRGQGIQNGFLVDIGSLGSRVDGQAISAQVSPENQYASLTFDIPQWMPTELPAGQELKVIRQTGYQERYDWDKIKLVYAPADVVITSKNYTRDIHTAGAFTLGGGLYGERMTDQEVQNDIGALLSMGNTTDSPVKWKWVKVNGYDALAREKTPISHSIVTIEENEFTFGGEACGTAYRR